MLDRWLLTSLSGPGAKDVPPGNFDPLEKLSGQEAKGGNFVGGTGMVQIVRYKDSPAGMSYLMNLRDVFTQ